MEFYLTTLGCKVNQYDGAAVGAALRRAGWTQTDGPDQAQLVVVNTCCVTATAMQKSRQAIRRLVRQADSPAVLVVGCYSDYDGRRIGKILTELDVPANRSAVFGHHRGLAEKLEQFLGGLADGAQAGFRDDDATPQTIRSRRLAAVESPAPGDLGPIDRFDGHQRAFVKVQDGCDAFCTYCIVPLTRSRVSWRPIELVAEECSRLVGAGHKEIVLCGVFLGAYGRDTAVRERAAHASSLPKLLARIADIPGLWRVRLSSLEPADLTDELLAVCATLPTVAPHFHLPLQSGSDAVLKRMNRQYTAEEFRQTVDRLRNTLDRPAITTDIIVGFPGETDADFAGTLELARQSGFAKIHAFPFSAIEGTAAFAWKADCPPADTVKARLAELTAVETDSAVAYRSQFLGQTLEGLIESPRRATPNARQAMTDRYLTVSFSPPPKQRPTDLTGSLGNFRIHAIHAGGLTGRYETC